MDIKTVFPNASQSFLALNTGQVAELEHDHKHCGAQPVRPARNKAEDSKRFLVCIESVRKRLLDWDNLCEKFHVDCCRYAGILPGDAPKHVEIETRQRKTGKGEAEHTMIEIFEL